MSPPPYDVLAFGAHPDDLEAVMGGTAAKLVDKGRSVLFVDLCDGEPTRHGQPGQRGEQASKAASILGVDRHCRMEPPWPSFDFAVDVTGVYARKLDALTAYESVFSGSQADLLEKYTAEDRYVGSLVGVRYAEAFKARSPLLVADPEAFDPSRYG